MRKANPFLAVQKDNAPIMEINTTPLIDVMLVLLITLIVTMPVMTHAVKLNLPNQGGPRVEREVATVEIDMDGSIYWNDQFVVDYAQLEQHFRATAAKADRAEVRVRANRLAKYDVFAKVLAAAQRNGIRNMGIVGNEKFGDEQP
jgi:biopolymer transport protein ExbD